MEEKEVEVGYCGGQAGNFDLILIPVRTVDNAGQRGSMAAFWASAAFDQRMVI